MELVIGNKAWSSWSLRPWLVLKRAGAVFDEVQVALRRPDTADAIARAGSPSGQVPVLRDGAVVVWDSLAICEYVAERYPHAALWPADAAPRAVARSAAAQMHAGFPALRSEMPMDLHARTPIAPSEAVLADLRRLSALWRYARDVAGGDGPFLYGGWGIVDAMFTPVASRLRTYGVRLEALGLDPWGDAYATRLLAEPEFLAWEAGA